MVVGDIASGFTGIPSFRPASRPPGSATGRGGGIKSFVDGIMSPLVSCWQPPINSCVPGCVAPNSPRFGSETPAVVSPMADRHGQYHSHPASPTRSQSHVPTSYPKGLCGDAPSTFSKETQPLANIEKPHSNDVLCGRGGSSNRHLGNMHFRELVAANKKTYVGLTKKQKMLVARKIVEMVHSTNPPGRFLAKDLDTGLWYDIGLPRSLEKTSQALREKNSNDVPVNQQAISDESLKDEKKEEPSSDPAPSKTKSSKNVEAPPIAIPDHLRDIYGSSKSEQDKESGNHRGPWPDFPAPSSSAHRRLEQPFLNSYPSSPTTPTGETGHPYCRQVPPRSPPAYPGYGNTSMSSVHHSSYHHGPPDNREHYEQYHHHGPDRREHYATPSHPMDRTSSSRSPRLPPPPPGYHHRRHLAPPPHHPPSQHYHHHQAPPTSIHRPPQASPHHGRHTGGSVPMQQSTPTSPLASPTASHDYDYEYYSHPRYHHDGQSSTGRSHHPPPPSHSHVYRSPNVRSKAEVSPERRQEWKRQRNSDGVARRLSETSLTHAMEERLSLDERVVGREREQYMHHARPVHPPHCSSSSIATNQGRRVVMGHRELLEHHRANQASVVEAPALDRDLMSPSSVLQSRSRRSLPLIHRRSGPETAAGVNESGAATPSSQMNNTTSRNSANDASHAGVDTTKLSGLAALSTAAFLKLDESS